MSYGKYRLAVVFLALISGIAAEAATLSVSPSTINNTYAGMVTLSISGLTNGETVLVERVLDADANGVADAGDILAMRFALTDGQVAAIGGATNLNVPGDVDPAGGAITAKLNYYAPGLNHFIGRHLWRLESPLGRFASTTKLFTVTDTAYAQSVAGAVRSGGTNLPYAMVVAVNVLADHTFAAATFADATGGYSLRLPVGVFQLIATKPGFVTDMTIAPVVALTSGLLLATNLSVAPSSRTISGKLADAADINATLPGVFIQAESSTGQFAPAWTDPSGNFTVAVNVGEWSLQADAADLNRLGYLFGEAANRTFNTDTGNVSDVVLSSTKADALFHGRVLDPTDAPISGVRFLAYGSVGGVHFNYGEPVADDEGNYAAPAVGGRLGGDSWWNLVLDPILNPALSNKVVSGFLIGVPILSGQAIRQDFRAINAAHRITGRVKDSSGGAVPGVGVFGWANLGGTNYYGLGYTTDSAGNYGMNVAGGAWAMQANVWSLLNAGYNCAPTQPVTLPGDTATANFTVFPRDRPGLSDPTHIASARFQFGLHGEPFVNYQIQYSTNLVQWFHLTTLTPRMEGLAYANFSVTDNTAGGPLRFYRAIRLMENFVSIEGVVRNGNTQAPIDGAVVTTSLDGSSTVTDGNGRFFLQTQTPAVYSNTPYAITVTKSGFQTFSGHWIWGDRPRNQVFLLYP